MLLPAETDMGEHSGRAVGELERALMQPRTMLLGEELTVAGYVLPGPRMLMSHCLCYQEA